MDDKNLGLEQNIHTPAISSNFGVSQQISSNIVDHDDAMDNTSLRQ